MFYILINFNNFTKNAERYYVDIYQFHGHCFLFFFFFTLFVINNMFSL